MAIGCCCRCKKRLPPVDIWENITKVAAYPSAPDPTPISPYSRPWYEWSSPSCVLASDPVATCGGSNQEVCFNQGFDGSTVGDGSGTDAARVVPDGIEECNPAEGETVDGAANNCYRKPGTQADLSHDCLPGWKGVTAVAWWPGRYGFSGGDTNGQACCNSGGQEQSKYSSFRHHVLIETTQDYWDYQAYLGFDDYHYTENSSEDWDQTATVDAYGNISRTGTKNIDLTREWNAAFGDLQGPGAGAGTFTRIGCYDSPVETGLDINWPEFGDTSIEQLENLLSVLRAFKWNCGLTSLPQYDPGNDYWNSLSGKSWEDFQAEILAILPDADNETTDTCAGTPYSTQHTEQTTTLEDLNFGDDWMKIIIRRVMRRRDWECVAGVVNPRYDLQKTIVITVELKLDNPITFAEVMDDAIALLDEFPLHDDAVYPFRQDAKTWLQPLVYRDARATEPTISWEVDDDCQFIGDGTYTGEIRGAHLPAGYNHGASEGHFDFTHINWMRNYDGAVCQACEQSVGKAVAAPLPMTTTAWTNYEEGAWHCGPGAHVQQIVDFNYAASSPGPTPISGVRVSKWAETLDRWPSINLFRPFADDRWRLDFTKSSCIAGEAGLVLTTDTDISASLAAGDLVAIYGGSGTYADQIWYVDSVAGTSITLDTQLDVPSAFLAAVRAECANHGEWGTYGVVGRLRWQGERNGDGIMWPWQRVTGRHAAITVDPVDTYKLTVPDGIQLISGDKVDLLDISNNLVVSCYYKRLTNTTGEIYSDLALTTPEDGTGASNLRGHEDSTPPAQSWDTDASRNTVIVRTWESKYREATTPDLTEEQFTLSRSRAVQCVFCVSPNSQDTDYFENNNSGSVVKTWDNTLIEADMCYGKEWHCDVVQAINDPFWQAPDVACATVAQEAYPCEAAASSYKYPPLVEPLLEIPDGDSPAPVLPDDVTLHEVGTMPTAVSVGGATDCPSVPNDRATIHAIREAWEACDDWEAMVNHGQ